MPIAISQTLPTILTHRLSHSQQEIWFAAQLGDAASAAFNQSCVLDLKGTLDHGALSDALDDLTARHDALRTSFSAAGDEQRVHAELPLFCPVLDFSTYAPVEQNELVQNRLRAETQSPFNLTKGPLIRAVLMKLGPARHLLAITVHHLICDGTSLNLLVEELAERYSHRKAGVVSASPLPVQFSQCVSEQLADGAKRAEAEKYWVAQFQQPAPFLELPLDRPRPKTRTFRGAGALLKLEPALAQEFRRTAARNRCTLFAASLAAFYVLLHRLSGQADLVVGVPMSARSTEGGHEVVGHCVNFLPLRLSVAGNPTFTEHLANVRRMLLDAMDHVNYNFGSLIQKLNLPRHPTRAPLVSTMFNVDHIQKGPELDGLDMELAPNPYCLANFDFSLSLEDREGNLEARCLYSADMLEPATAARWLRHFETLLRSAVANPQARIGHLSLLTPTEQRLIVSCSGTEEHLIHDLLPEELAASTRPGTPELETYVVDGYGQFALPGVPGELCIAGLSLNEVSLPPEKLLKSPQAGDNGHLWFRTGRHARYLGNGDMEILDAPPRDERPPMPVRAIPGVPRSEVQSKLTGIWREVMQLDTIQPDDDFFDLGGHSLLVTQIIARVRSIFGVQLALRDFFEAPTITALARVVEEQILRQVEQMPEAQAERLAVEALAVG